MSIEEEISRFLTTNQPIKKINFAFKKNDKYKVYPAAYSKDIVDALKSGDLIVKTQQALPAGARARYNDQTDRLEFGYGFQLTDYRSQSDLVHECTHAHLDIQAFGLHSLVEDEAVAYVAEAVFLEASGKKPMDNSGLRKAAHDLARRIIKGEYWFSNDDIGTLLIELNKIPQYAGQTVVSSGFKRKLGAKIWRHF